MPAKDQQLIISDEKYADPDSGHQAAWKTIAVDKTLLKALFYYINDQWWFCARMEVSEIYIVSCPASLNPKTQEKIAVLNKMQRLLYYTRGLREVVAMQWAQLFYVKQPRYQLVADGTTVDDTKLSTGVAVTPVPHCSNLLDYFDKPGRVDYLAGIAEVLCDIFITGDVDPNLGNILIRNPSSRHKETSIVRVDGDKCWPRLREYTATDRFKVDLVFTHLLQQKMPTKVIKALLNSPRINLTALHQGKDMVYWLKEWGYPEKNKELYVDILNAYLFNTMQKFIGELDSSIN